MQLIQTVSPILPARQFVTAGRAFFTVQSRATGKHFTYRANTRSGEDCDTSPVFLSILTGQSNESDYKFFGILTPKTQRFVFSNKSSRVSADAPGVKAFEWFWKHSSNPKISEKLTFLHEGRCCRCNRKLTHPESILLGAGPECKAFLGL